MGVVILYGVYEFLFAGLARKTGTDVKSNTVEISSFVSDLTNELAKDSLTGKTDAYIIARAEADWQKNPFLEKGLYREWAVREGATVNNAATVKFIYSGYVDSGKKKIAVINGIEYFEGEKLETEGYVLKKITNSFVVISNRSTGNEVEVSIQE